MSLRNASSLPGAVALALALAGCRGAEPEAGWAIVAAVQGPGAGDLFGSSVCAVGDWNGDGVGDLAVGSPGPDRRGVTGQVHVVSGASLEPVQVIAGPEGSRRFGAALAALGDLDGDGRDDLLVGAPGACARVHLVLSGGGVLYTRESDVSDDFGSQLLTIPDVDGDGVDDFALGLADAGAVEVRSGSTGEELWSAPIDVGRGGIGALRVPDDAGTPALVVAGGRGRVSLVRASDGEALAERTFAEPVTVVARRAPGRALEGTCRIGAWTSNRRGDVRGSITRLDHDLEALETVAEPAHSLVELADTDGSASLACLGNALVTVGEGRPTTRLERLDPLEEPALLAHSSLWAVGDLDSDGVDELVLATPSWGPEELGRVVLLRRLAPGAR